MSVKNLLEGILCTLFPRPCPLCRAVILDKQERFCPACLQGFEIIREPFCPRCGIPVHAEGGQTEGLLCPACLSRGAFVPPLPRVRSIALYSGSVREAILRVKFGGQTPVARSLSLFVTDHYGRLFPSNAFDGIVPVPLHPKRLREREFNQCVLLAGTLAAHLGIPLEPDLVERVRHTPPQTASTEAERRKNLRGAFRVARPDRVKRRSILLFDDVYTTGATLEELARTLRAAGARSVAALTLARSPHPGAR